MPELPDITVYIERLDALIVGQPLTELDVRNAFVLRSVSPTPAEMVGRRVTGIRRMGKRIVIGFDGGVFVVMHLMIAGRLRWRATGKKSPGKIALAAFVFPNGTLYFTEAGSTRRASMHLISGESGLAEFDRGGLEVLDSTAVTFGARLTAENHTLKRALTDPRLFSGIGNAYSDEILHRARLSPLLLTSKLDEEKIARLHDATLHVLAEWTDRLRSATGEFPEEVTAFHEEMAVHGRFGQPCPVCGSPVQRIRYATNETNYCARCQTGGRLLADRALSRLLKQDWPRSIDELD